MRKPPLLPPPSRKVAKDAAQVVKRVYSLTTRAVTAKTLSDLLGLPVMRMTRFAVEDKD
jgi:hypothetical protein